MDLQLLPWLLLFWTVVELFEPDNKDNDNTGYGHGRDGHVGIRVPLRNGIQDVEFGAPPPPRARVPRSARDRDSFLQNINFVEMIDNLRGKSGQGYYVEMTVGSPPQKVSLPSSAMRFH